MSITKTPAPAPAAQPGSAKRPQSPAKNLGLIWALVTVWFIAIAVIPVGVKLTTMCLLIVAPALAIQAIRANPGLQQAMKVALMASAAIAVILAFVGIKITFFPGSPASSQSTYQNQPAAQPADVPANDAAPPPTQVAQPASGALPTLAMSEAERLVRWVALVPPTADWPDPKLSDSNQYWVDWVNQYLDAAPVGDSYTGPGAGTSWITYGPAMHPQTNLVASRELSSGQRTHANIAAGYTCESAETPGKWTGGPGDQQRMLRSAVHHDLTDDGGTCTTTLVQFTLVQVGNRSIVQVTASD